MGAMRGLKLIAAVVFNLFGRGIAAQCGSITAVSGGGVTWVNPTANSGMVADGSLLHGAKANTLANVPIYLQQKYWRPDNAVADWAGMPASGPWDLEITYNSGPLGIWIVIPQDTTLQAGLQGILVADGWWQTNPNGLTMNTASSAEAMLVFHKTFNSASASNTIKFSGLNAGQYNPLVAGIVGSDPATSSSCAASTTTTTLTTISSTTSTSTTTTWHREVIYEGKWYVNLTSYKKNQSQTCTDIVANVPKSVLKGMFQDMYTATMNATMYMVSPGPIGVVKAPGEALDRLKVTDVECSEIYSAVPVFGNGNMYPQPPPGLGFLTASYMLPVEQHYVDQQDIQTGFLEYPANNANPPSDRYKNSATAAFNAALTKLANGMATSQDRIAAKAMFSIVVNGIYSGPVGAKVVPLYTMTSTTTTTTTTAPATTALVVAEEATEFGAWLIILIIALILALCCCIAGLAWWRFYPKDEQVCI